MLAALLLISFASIAFGVFFAYQGARLVAEARRSRRWTPVPAVIERSEIVATMVAGGTTPASFGRRESFHAAVRFRYRVNGSDYVGNRLGFSTGQTTQRKSVAARLAPYGVGAAVEAYYDPVNPASAVLVREAGSTTPVLIGTGIFFVLAGLVVAGAAFLLRWYE